MGITLHAIVELGHNGHWWEISRWKLGKDYDAQRVVREYCEPEWPPDASLSEKERKVLDAGQYWTPIDCFPGISNAWTSWRSLEACPSEIWLSLEESLVPLAGRAARVLFWTL